ncbi:MAG: DNA helicase RecQ [Crocinitomicaceae bacterium]
MKIPVEILRSVFGYDSFRQNQKEIIEHALADQDALVIMPTGGGKSICFQIPALIKEHTTLVISPLIALMKDQVENLRSNGVNAAYYNSSLTESSRNFIRQQALSGELKLLYLSPETLLGGIDWIKSMNISMVAIDEAHCVSMWGHDFRPEYQQIGEIRKYFPNIPYLAFTATADKVTRKDIAEKLSLRNPTTFISSFDRPNLSLAVRPQVPKKQKVKEVVQFINERNGESGIIYCLSKKETEAWAAELNEYGIHSRYYHAGMGSAERDEIQEGFINDEFQVICATIAFGMGIDKPNIRWVIHNNLPKNVEGYYQEIGRAGRDGLPADTILYYNYRDVVLLNDFVAESNFKEVYHEKINRMLKYAEASTCRRRILLAYFGEHLLENCGNCDICLDPPEFIDGQVIAQKALSAIVRANERLGLNILINVLRGGKTIEIIERGLDKIKTYGAGKEFSFKDWQHFINQLIDQGVIEIAYDQHMHLKVSELGHAVLRNEQSVQLTEFKERELKKKEEKKTGSVNSELYNILKDWRKELAVQNSVPAYVIFNDATLGSLATVQPTTIEQLHQISGLGKVKIDRFGKDLIEIILSKGTPKISTYEATFQLYSQGMNVEEIAISRQLSAQTILNHLIKLYEEGKKVDLYQFITEYELQEIKAVRSKLKNTHQLKPIHEATNGQYSYEKISVALALLNKHISA